MSTYPDHDRARRVFNAAVLRSEAIEPLPGEWLERVDRIGRGQQRTFVAMIGTALLARATEARVDPLTLKTSADAAQAMRAYSARALAQHVLVPVAKAHHVDLGVHGREPLNNSPFYREDRVHRGLRAMHPDELDYLVDSLERVRQLSRPEAQEALAAFVRLRREVAASSGQSAALWGSTVGLSDLVAVTARFVVQDPEEGRRGQAMVAAGLDLVYPEVTTSNVHASDRRLAGDVFVREGAQPRIGVEVKQKAVTRDDVLGYAAACARGEIRQAVYVAIAPAQPALPWDEIVADAAAASGVALIIITSPASFLAFVAALAPDVDHFVKGFPGRMLARLEELDASHEGREQWAVILATSQEH